MEKAKKIIYNILMLAVFLLGIYLRAKLYLGKGVFEDDECRLAYSMYTLNIWQMFGPLGPWSSSPIFMFVSKIIAHFTHYNEFALEFLPFVFSLTSIFVFFKLTEEYFERKVIKLLANYFFAINTQFLFFTATFKQYSLEVLMALLCLYYLPKINILELTKKQLGIFIAIIAILPLISIPSLFYIGAFVIINIFIHWKDKKELFKKFLIIAIPFLIVFALYYIFNLAPIKALQTKYFTSFWDKFYSFNIFTSAIGHLSYAFTPNRLILCQFLLLICSLIMIIFDKNYKNKRLGQYMFIIYALILFASAVNIYPFMTRVGLHIIPAIILLILKPIDSLSTKSFILYPLICFLLLGFCAYFTSFYMKEINKGFVSYAPNSLLKVIKQKYNEKEDLIAIDEASMFSYYFYAKKNDFFEQTRKKRVFINYRKQSVKNDIYSVLNNIDPNYNYWFYLIKEYKDNQKVYIEEWINEQPNVQFKVIDRASCVYYIKPPYKKVNP